MTITLNHTIIPASDKRGAAEFFAGLLGLEVSEPVGPFVPVHVNGDLTFDFLDQDHPASGHYAFLVDDATFDRALAWVAANHIDFGSGPADGWNGEIYRLDGGRGVYVPDPDGHSYELFTAVSESPDKDL
jgi:catechol 2,3-dioxygenase-like lactoylglutathione lyase family enzyme